MGILPNGTFGSASQSLAVRQLLSKVARAALGGSSGTRKKRSKKTKAPKKTTRRAKSTGKKAKSKGKSLTAGSAAAKAWGKKMAKLRKK